MKDAKDDIRERLLRARQDLYSAGLQLARIGGPEELALVMTVARTVKAIGMYGQKRMWQVKA